MVRGGGIFQRAMQYVLNELLVERLSNSVTFQRFAVRSSKAIEDLAQKGAQKKEAVAEQLRSIKDEVARSLKDK